MSALDTVAAWCLGGAPVAGWTLDLAVTGPLGAAALLYGAGVARLWRRAGIGRGARPARLAAFAAGWAVLAVALVSPLHAASRTVFTAHMVGHELAMAVAAPLLVLARPLGPMLWALPRRWRVALGAAPRQPVVAAVWGTLRERPFATALHGLAIWGWHVPGVYEAALADAGVHLLQHASFLGTALLFWWALASGRRRSHGAAIGHLFATAGHTGLLGLLLVVAPRPLFPAQGTGSSAWGLTALEDQQLAGLVMWVPAGLVYAGAALACTGLWIAAASSEGGRHAVPR